MAGEKQLGSIVYQVELEVGRMIESQRQVNARLDAMDRGFANTGRAADNTGRSFTALTKVASALAAALSVQQVAAYGNAWVTVSNKLVNSVRANEDLFTVTKRVFDISQDTRASLEATATLYGRLERATRSAGTSTADLATLTETINKGLTVSGATTEEASSTMIQLSQALASGVLRGEEFNSISENGSRLAVALADSLGVTIGQLRAMAAQGQLTTEVVVNGLLKQSDQIAKEFTNTTLTMSQAFTVATNNITKFVGEASSVNTTLNVFNQGVIALSENLDVVAAVVGAFSILLGGRFVGALAASTAAKVKSAIASREMSVANLQSVNTSALEAAATLRSAEAAKVSAQAELSLAVIMKDASLTADRLAIAETRLSAARIDAAAATQAYNRALAANAAAQKTAEAAARSASLSMTALKGGLALIGGPAGAAMIAAAAVYYFFQRTQEARASAFAFADSISSVVTKMKEMSDVQLAAEIAKASQATKVQTSAIEDQRAVVAGITKDIDNQSASMRIYGATASKLQDVADLTDNLAIETGKLAKMEDDRSRTVNSSAILQAKLNGALLTGNDLLDRNGMLARVAAGAMTELGMRIDGATGAKERFNATSLQVSVSKEGQKQLDQLTQENELLQITDKRQRAVKAARLDAINAGEGNQNVINQLGQLAGANYDLQQAESARNKAAKDGAKTTDEGAKKIADLQRQLEYLKLSYDENSREAAVYNAVASAGAKATEAQKKAIGEYAGALFDAKQKQSDLNAAIAADPVRNADKAYSDASKQLKRQYDEGIVDQQQFNQESLKLAQDHANAIAQANANNAVTPQQAAAGTVDPVQQLANDNAKKLALIQQFETNKTITEQQGIELRRAANKQYEQERTDAMFQLWSQQTIGNEVAANALEAFGQSASSSLAGVITGAQSASDAMMGIANTVMSSVIKTFVDMGVQWAKSAIMGGSQQIAMQSAVTASSVAGTATTTAASVSAAGVTTAAWTPAALVASVASFGGAAAIGAAALFSVLALSGKRKNGGPVTAGGMYQVGEGGMPEIYQSSSGRQYMIPGDNGSVISNKDMQGGGGGSSGGLIVNINNYTPATVDMQQTPNANGGMTLDVFIADMENGGPASQAITSNTSATRRANNQ